MAERWVFALAAGACGLAIGSVLNACRLRWAVDESVVRPHSRCPGCGVRLRWHDNIPVVGWLARRGRCRSCAIRLSVQYPLIELAAGLVWMGTVWVHGPVEGLRGAVFLTVLLGIALTEACFYVIPDQFSLGGTLLGFGFAFLHSGITPLASALGIAVGLGVLWLVRTGGTWLIRRLRPARLSEVRVDQVLGGGDVKMMGMVGAFLGAWGVATTLFLGSVTALLVFGPFSARTKRLIPLGVFLAVGAAVSYGWGEALLGWYRAHVLLT